MMMVVGTIANIAFAPTRLHTRSQPDYASVRSPTKAAVNWSGVGYGAGSLLTNVLYIPANWYTALCWWPRRGGAYVLNWRTRADRDTICALARGRLCRHTPDAPGQASRFTSAVRPTRPPLPATAAAVQPMSAAPPNAPAPWLRGRSARPGRRATDGPGAGSAGRASRAVPQTLSHHHE